MNETLISFETAKLAKEKGFNLNSPGFYSCDNPSSEKIGNQLILRDWERWINFGSEDSQEGTMIYSAPTQTMLQKWLREVHNIDIYIFPVYSDSTYSLNRKLLGYTPIIQSIKIDECNLKTENTYESALEVALQKALKLI